MLTDQKELFGLVASVPTVWRTLSEIARGGPGALAGISVAVHAAGAARGQRPRPATAPCLA